MAYKIHDLAKCIPEMRREEYEALKADIRENGQQVPIVKLGDTILDGRHRYRVCQELDLVPLIAEWDGRGGSALNFISAMNLHRRHLLPGQRGLAAAEIKKKAASSNFSPSQDTDGSGQKPGMSFSEAAAAMQVSEATVKDAALVLEKGTAREINAVREGNASPSAVAREIRAGKPAKERAAARKQKTKPKNKATAAPKAAKAPPPPTKRSTREFELIVRMKEAVTALSFMPDTSVVVGIIRNSDAKQYVEDQMYKGQRWLNAFVDEWIRAQDEAPAAQVKS